MIRQVQTKNTTCKAVIRTKAFVKGFNEVREGKAPDYDAFRDANEQWNYERGRQFALTFPGKIKFGSTVNQTAAWSFGMQLVNKSII